MRLVQLAGYDGPYPGSSIPMILAALREARKRGWTVDAVFPETVREATWRELFEAEDIPLRIMERAPRRELAARVRELLDEQPGEPTILHTHFTVYDVPAVMAARSVPGITVLWHLHTPHGHGLVPAARMRAKLAMYGRDTLAILCVAPHMTERVQRLGAGSRARFFPNGIDTHLFHPVSPEERDDARALLGVHGNSRPVIGHLAWDWEVKGGDILLEAVRRLRDSGRNVRVVTRAADPARARADVERLDLGDAVTLLERIERIQTLYAAADMFVSPSRKEGMPFTLLEALLSGVPVVASEIPGHQVIAKDYPGCRLVPGTPQGIAEGIAALLEADPDAVAAEIADSAKRIQDTMSLEAWTERLFALYDER